MKSKQILLLLALSIPLVCIAQVETKRWWNLGATVDIDRAVFCTDDVVKPIDELIAAGKEAGNDTERLRILMDMIRSYQEQVLIYKAIACADSALNIAIRLNDSLSVCRIHIGSVYHKDMSGNPGGMLSDAKLALRWMPYSAKGTLDEFKLWAVTGDAYSRLLQYKEAEEAYRKASTIVDRFESPKCKGHIYMSMGKALYGTGKVDMAIQTFKQGVGIFKALGDSVNCCVLYSRIAEAYSSLGMRNKQLQYLRMTLATSERLGNYLQRAVIYRDLGSFYKEQNDSTMTSEFYHKAIDMFLKVSGAFAPTLGDSHNDMADFYYYMGNREKALDYQRRSVKSYWAFPRPVALMTYKLGYLHYNYGQLDSALYYFNDAHRRSEALNDPRLLATSCKGLANYYRTVGNIPLAIGYAEQSYENALKIQFVELIRDVCDQLSGLYEASGDFPLAYRFEQQRRRLTDSLNLSEGNRETARLAAQVELAEEETRMSLQIAEQQRHIRTQWILFILLMFIMTLLLVLGIVILRNNRQRRKTNKELKNQKEELAATNEELYATNEELAATNEEMAATNDQLTEEYTARMVVMQQLADSESKVRSFIEQSFEGIMMVDNDGRVVEWNHTLEQMTGCPAGEAVGRYEWDLLWTYLPQKEQTPEKLQQLQQLRQDYIGGGSKQEPLLEELELFLHGEIRYMEASIFPVAMAGTCYFGRILHDITGQKLVAMEMKQYYVRLEEMVELKTHELNLAKEKAEESDKLKSAFLANMSHEIRTPLNGIVGFLNYLAADDLPQSRRREYTNIVNNSSSQLVKLIDDIIDISKIEAGQMSIYSVPCNINELMYELYLFFVTYMESNQKDHVEMILDDSGFIDPCIVTIDPVRLRQVLNNLIGNAAKFTDKGYIRFGYRQPAPDRLEFMVEDTGVGIASDQLSVIFERFRQADLGDTRRGTGLGLTISQNLVRIMGGDMRVESTKGIGSTFYFTIACRPAPAPGA